MTTNDLNAKALKAGIWYVITNFLIRGFNILTVPIFARILAKADYGAFSNYTSWISILMILTTLDLATSIQRAIYDYQDDIDAYISTVFILGSLFSTGCYLFVFICRDFFVQLMDMDFKYISIMFLYMILSPALSLFQAKHRSEMKYKFVTALIFISVLSATIVSIILVLFMEDKFWGRVVGQSGTLTILNILIAGYILIKGRAFKLEHCKYALMISLPLIPNAIGGYLLSTVDRVLISEYCGEEYTALYSLVYTCALVLMLLQNSLNSAWNPWLFVHLHNKNYEPVKKAFKPFVMMFCALASLAMLFAPEIVFIIGGESYKESVILMPPIMMGYVCFFMYTLFVSTETYHKKTFGISVRTVLAGLFNLVTNIIFIPIWGYAAAAYTTFASFFLLLLLHWRAGKKLGTDLYYDSKFIFVLTGIMTVFSSIALAAYYIQWLRFALILLFFFFALSVIFKYKIMVFELMNIFKRKG